MRPQVCSQVAPKALTGPSPEPLSSTPALQFAASDGERAPASCADPDRPLGHVPAPVTMLAQQSLKVGIPNVARIYNYLLGGKDNYSADREAAMELVRLIPEVLTACRNNRRFLQRAVRFLAGEAGVRQFIDIGTGLPAQGNVHEVAQDSAPDARVLYVDYDPVVVSHAQALLAAAPAVVAINRDLRQPGQIIAHRDFRALIDLGRPVAILLVAILHFITDDDDPYGIVDELKAAMPSGSYLVLSHVTADDVSPQVASDVRRLYDRATAPAAPRTRAGIERFFDGLEIIAPGLTDVGTWRELSEAGRESLPRPGRTLFLGGVGRKP